MRLSSKRKIVFKSKSRSNRESNGSSSEFHLQYSNSDHEDENYAHPEDILWDYEAILNERNVDGKIQFLVKWKDIGSYKFEP